MFTGYSNLIESFHTGTSTCAASSTVDVRQGAESWWQRSLGYEGISIQQASSSAILCNLLIHAGEPLWKPQGLWQLACKLSFPFLLLYLVSLSEVLSAFFGMEGSQIKSIHAPILNSNFKMQVQLISDISRADWLIGSFIITHLQPCFLKENSATLLRLLRLESNAYRKVESNEQLTVIEFVSLNIGSVCNVLLVCSTCFWGWHVLFRVTCFQVQDRLQGSRSLPKFYRRLGKNKYTSLLKHQQWVLSIIYPYISASESCVECAGLHVRSAWRIPGPGHEFTTEWGAASDCVSWHP